MYLRVCVRVCVRVCMRMYMYVCACVRENLVVPTLPPLFPEDPPHTHPFTSTVAPARELTHKATVPPQQMEMKRQ